jgi:hypothetical protein
MKTLSDRKYWCKKNFCEQNLISKDEKRFCFFHSNFTENKVNYFLSWPESPNHKCRCPGFLKQKVFIARKSWGQPEKVAWNSWKMLKSSTFLILVYTLSATAKKYLKTRGTVSTKKIY